MIPKELAALGVVEGERSNMRPRILVGSEGLDKSGKTELMLSQPGPVGVLNFDIGLEGVVGKWEKVKKVWVYRVKLPVVGSAATYTDAIKRAREVWVKMLENPEIRSVGIDTADQLWELSRLAEFGQLNPSHDVKRAYPAVNQFYRQFIRAVFDTDKNAVFTHRLKKKYKTIQKADGKSSDEWDGVSYERIGFGEMNYLVQVNVAHRYTDGEGFSMRVINCRQNMSIAGMELPQSECNFVSLATLVHEDTTEADWK